MYQPAFLAHYGVSGMKWGHRRGYDSVSPTTQRISKRLESKRLSPEKRANLESKLSRSQKYDKLINDHAKSITMGKAYAEHFFTGSSHVKYKALQKAGYTRGEALVKTVLNPAVDMRRPVGPRNGLRKAIQSKLAEKYPLNAEERAGLKKQ